MSRIVTGYVNGRPIYRDQGPARAAMASRGGLTLGQALTRVSEPTGAAEVKPVGVISDTGRSPFRADIGKQPDELTRYEPPREVPA